MARRSNPRDDDAAPLLWELHQAQAREGALKRSTLEKLALSLGVPLADLYGTASFYHYFTVEGNPPLIRAACRGPVCSLPGIASKSDGKLPSISCPALCDQPPAEFDSGRFFSTASMGEGLRLPEPVQTEEAIFRSLRIPEPRTLESYRRTGGYEQPLKLAQTGDAAKALDLLQESTLSGRGGAGFPLAAKWRAVRDAQATPKYVVCNADEGEPGTFKDRPVLHLQPHLLLEAMAICGIIIGAETGIIYLRYEYPQALQVLSKAIEEAESAGLLGKDIAGRGFNFYVHVRRGAGSYVCGEETALLNSLEGRRPWPRERPPFPTTQGLWGKPTVVNNVETLCSVPPILERGPEWFRSLGRGKNAGTKIYSVSGKVRRPGNYELPLGITARELIFGHAGGVPPDRSLKAFTLGGISGGLLSADHVDLLLDYRAPERHGRFLGSGGVIVLDDTCCVVDFVRCCMLFYESESCGKCYPCRIGTVRLRELLDGLTGKGPLAGDAREKIEQIGAAMSTTSACGLGQSAPLVVTGMLKLFAAEVEAHLNRNCPAGICGL